MMLFSLLGILFVLIGIRKENKWDYLTGGIFVGISTLMKQPGILTIIIIFGIFLLIKSRTDWKWIKVIKSSIIAVLGALIPILVAVVYILETGAWNDMIDQTIVTIIKGETKFIYIGNIKLISQFAVGFPIIFYIGIIGILFTLLHLYKSFRNSNNEKVGQSLIYAIKIDYKECILFLWAVLIFLAIMKFPPRGQYILQLLPPLCIFAGIIFSKIYVILTKNIESYKNREIRFLSIFSCFVIFILLIFSTLPDPYPMEFIGKDTIYTKDGALFDVADYIKVHTNNSDTIYTFGFYPQLYIYADRDPASIKYNCFEPGMIFASNTTEIEESIIKDISTNKPIYIITFENNLDMQILNETGGWYKDYTDIIEYIKEYYSVEKIFQNDDYWPEGDIYLWRIKDSQ